MARPISYIFLDLQIKNVLIHKQEIIKILNRLVSFKSGEYQFTLNVSKSDEYYPLSILHAKDIKQEATPSSHTF